MPSKYIKKGNHGGRRINSKTGKPAGRTKGSKNKRTMYQELLAAGNGQLSTANESPLAVMLYRMRYHHTRAMNALNKIAQIVADVNAGKVLTEDEEAQFEELNTYADKELLKADEAARGASPYVHHRLSAVEHSGTIDNKPKDLTHEEVLQKLKERGLPVPPTLNN